MTELLDPGLRARFDAALPAPVLDDAAVGSLLRRGRRRRLARQAGGGVAAVAVVAALVVGGMSLLDRSPAPPVAPPEEEATVGGDLWLSAEVVPPGAEVVGVLVDQTNSGQVFDQLASVERWIDGEWVDRAEPLLWCLPWDPCSAEVMEPGTAVDFQPVEIAPGPGLPGPAMRMSTAGLEPGWYRITHVSRSGAVASGVLEVADDAPDPAPLAPLDEPSLAVEPPILVPGDNVPLVLSPVLPEGGGGVAFGQGARVDAWVDGAWVTTQDGIPLGEGMDDGMVAVLVGVSDEPGEYRVVLSGPDTVVWGRFWVTEPVAPSGVASAPAEVLDAYVGLPEGGADASGMITRLESGQYALTISLPGSGECAAVPVATEVDGRTVTVVVRDPAQPCPPDGTHTTYVLALPDGASAESALTTRAEGSTDAPYPQLRLWLTDVVAETGLEAPPQAVDESGLYAVVGVWPREYVAVVAEIAGEAGLAAGVVPDGTAEVEGLVLETGTDDSGAAAARFSCGGLVLSFLGRNDTPAAFEDVRSVAEAVARVAQPCPVDADAITVP